MKTKQKKNAWRLFAAIAIAMAAAGCSDGELASGPDFNITPPPPVIISFAAEPSQIKAGESTSISWEVTGADAVEIQAVSSTGDAVSFHVQTEELSGSSPVAGLTSTTDFVLTAIKRTTVVTEGEAPAEGEGEEAAGMLLKSGEIQFGPETDPNASGNVPGGPGEASASQTITVTVIADERTDVAITAEKQIVEPGECTIINWTVTPAEGRTIVVSASDGTPVVATDQCDGDITVLDTLEEVTPTPAVGCAVVCPTARTDYTVTATGPDGDASDSVTIDVSDVKIEASITANGKDGLVEIDSYGEPVTIAWNVTPQTVDEVTIVANPAVAAATDAPCDLTGSADGTAVCKLTQKTTFTLNAKIGMATATDEVIVGAIEGGMPGLVVTDQWAFEGEDVPIAMELTPEAKQNTSRIKDVKISGQTIGTTSLATLLDQGKVTVTKTATLFPVMEVKMVYDPDLKETPPVKPVQVVDLERIKVGEDEVAVTSLTSIIDPQSGLRDIYAGVQFADFHGGVGRIRNQGGPIDFNFGAAIKGYKSMEGTWLDDFFTMVKNYPVAVAVKADEPNVIFAGTTGAVMMTKDGGKSWNGIMVSRRRGAMSTASDPSHATCGGTSSGEQKKLPGRAPSWEGDFISLNQICDIVISGSSVIVAHDFGVQVKKNYTNINFADENHYADWVPANGAPNGDLKWGFVVNDLELVSSKVYAAAEKGVYASNDGGITWTSFGSGITGPVFAIKYDDVSKKLFAGTKSGAYMCDEGVGNWQSIGLASTPVLSIAIDAYAPMTAVVAGTPSGVEITRDAGASWNKLSMVDADGNDVTMVEALLLDGIPAADASYVRYGISIGTVSGVYFDNFAISASKKSTEQPPAETPPEDAGSDGTAENADETPPPDGEQPNPEGGEGDTQV